MSNPTYFRAWLRRRRQERGLTQEDLGELVGYAAQTIAKIEGGQRRPSPQLALRLAEALQIDPAEHSAWMAAALADAEPDASPSAAPGPQAAPARSFSVPAPSLPAFLTPFVGRAREQAELAELLGRPDCRLVTLLGPGGVGKTRLAIETSRSIAGFADGVAFVSLASVAAPALIAPALGDALGVSFAGGDLLAQLIGHLRDRRALLIFDNMEHLLDADGQTLALLEQLLAQAPGVVALATSRERLRIAGEWVIALDGLPVPSAQTHSQLEAAPALALFAEHAERVDRAFRLTRENGATVATICQLVGGLPLGIELAAAWLRLLALDEIAHELAHGLDAAQISPRTLPARHHSLRAVVEHSWQLLNADERAALRRLAAFRGGFTREAATRVAGASVGMLAALADKSLLRRGAGGRYDLHEIIRQYADARLRELPGELAETRSRHAAFFLGFVAEREARLKGAEQAAAMAEIVAEIDNIRAAWPWGAGQGLLAELERAGEVLHWFYEFRSWLQEGAAFFAQAVERLRSAEIGAQSAELRRALGRMLGHQGYLASRFGAFGEAQAALAESADLLTAEHDALGLARTLLSQAQVAHWSGQYGQARRLLDQAFALTGDRHIHAMGATVASLAAQATGTVDEAERLFRAALATWRELGNPRGTIWCVTACSPTLLALGKHREAQQLLRESLRLSYATRDSGGAAMTLHNLGLVALLQGDTAEAIYFLREALPSLRTASSLVYAHALNDLGAALLRAGARDQAQRSYAQALEIAQQLQAHQEVLGALAGLATCQAAAGRHASALALAGRVLATPSSPPELRDAMAELQATARTHLPAGEAAQIEARAAAEPLASLLSELQS